MKAQHFKTAAITGHGRGLKGEVPGVARRQRQ